MVKLGKAYVVPNVHYTLDYTKTSYNAPATVYTIPIPSGRWRIVSWGQTVDSTANGNFVVKFHIDNSPFGYPNGSSEWNTPQIAYQIVGVVPTDYIDVEGGNNITLYSVMTGSAATNGNLFITLTMKQIIRESTDSE